MSSLSRLSLLSLPSSLDPRWSSSFFLSAPPSPRFSISAQSRSAFSREFIVSSVTIESFFRWKKERCARQLLPAGAEVNRNLEGNPPVSAFVVAQEYIGDRPTRASGAAQLCRVVDRGNEERTTRRSSSLALPTPIFLVVKRDSCIKGTQS